MLTFISPAEARAIVCAAVAPLNAERVLLRMALGRTARENVHALQDLPPFTSAGMDGFAVRTQDLGQLPATLPVTQTVAAGTVPETPVPPRTCMQIMTGAPVPAEADAIVPVEWTSEVVPGSVMIKRVPNPGGYIRAAGRDVKKGEVLVATGSLLTPPAIGQLAAGGVVDVAVSRQPEVAIIVTGDELHLSPGPLPPGKIRDATGPALAGQVQLAGGFAAGPYVARDTKQSVHESLEAAKNADVMVLAGGVSVGRYDVVKDVLEEAGMQFDFWRVRQRPGGPLVFGRLQGRPVFGLPGNPVSSFVCFEQYVRPLLHVLLGRTSISPRVHEAELSREVTKKKGLHQFVRGIAARDSTGALHVQPTGPQASNLYSSVAKANCLIHLPEEMEDPRAGSQVLIEWLPWAKDQD